MNQSFVRLTALAQGCRDLTRVYEVLYRRLCEELRDNTEVHVINISESINILIPDASRELKEQTRINMENFIENFSLKTGLSVVELS